VRGTAVWFAHEQASGLESILNEPLIQRSRIYVVLSGLPANSGFFTIWARLAAGVELQELWIRCLAQQRNSMSDPDIVRGTLEL
jgi:hypothetical protein